MPRSYSGTPWGIDNPDGADNIIVICKRLANTHKNDVCNTLAGKKPVFYVEHLFNNFTGSKVPFQPQKPACAKPAGHCAANLRRNTGSNPLAFSQYTTL